MSGHVKMQRITRQNRVHLQALREALNPEVLHAAVPRLATAAEGMVEYKAMMSEVSQLGKYCRADGFDPTRTFQHVAKIEVSVWSAILEAFGQFDQETGELGHDGLLYRTDIDGTIRLNRDFFYALIGWLEASGYVCDMRSKIKIH
jgi:hypothetical protein